MKCTHKRIYSGIPVGLSIRRQLGKEVIFRIRPGNGYYNAILGQVYQDQYTYFVPTSITNIEGQAARNAFANAVSAWQALSIEQKEIYNNRAQRRNLHMSGYNLFIREHINTNL